MIDNGEGGHILDEEERQLLALLCTGGSLYLTSSSTNIANQNPFMRL
jgi:hypothetical protein